MKEAYLHYIWITQSFNGIDLKTTSNETINIIQLGTHNKNADGPDFLFAKIQIDNIILVGHIEIHTNCKEWFHHKHHLDNNYDNVILHVVYEDDCKGKLPQIPTLELKNRLQYTSYQQWQNMTKSKDIYPCASYKTQIPEFIQLNTLYTAFIQRLDRKINSIKQNYGDLPLNDILKVLVSRVMGSVINADAFAQWTEKYWLSHPTQNQNAPNIQIKKKGVRPGSNPNRRMIQLRWIFENWELMKMEIEHISDYKVFRKQWMSRLNQNAPIPFTNFVIDNLFINALLIAIFYRADQLDDDEAKQRIVQLYDQIPAERNTTVDQWQQQLYPITSALQSQGILEWTSHACKNKQCLTCPIGHKCLQLF